MSNAPQVPQGQPQQAQTQSNVSTFARQGDPFDASNGNIFDQAANNRQLHQRVQQGNPSGLPDNPMPPAPAPTQGGFNPMEAPVPNGQMAQEGTSPLDKYMQKPDNAPNQGTPTNNPRNQEGQQPQQPFDPFSLTNTEYGKLLAQQNFVPEISQDQMQQMQQGDFSGLADIINQAVQQGASMSAHFATQVAQKGVNHHLSSFKETQLPQVLQDYSFDQAWQNSDSDILKHPTFEPLAKTKMQEFRQQYPDATQAQVIDATRRYFEDLSSAMQQVNASQSQPANTPTNKIGDFFK